MSYIKVPNKENVNLFKDESCDSFERKENIRCKSETITDYLFKFLVYFVCYLTFLIILFGVAYLIQQ